MMLMTTFNGWAQLIPFNENFSYTAGNLSGQGSWVLQGTDNTNPIQVTSPGLFYPGYQASGIGLAAGYGNAAGGQDLFKNFTGTNTINSGSVYISSLVKVTSATRAGGDYYLSFKETTNAGLSVFKGRLYAKDSLGTGNLVFGVTKSTVSGSVPVNWTSQYYSFGTTYLVVLKYTFISGTYNDVVDVFVFDPANPFPVTEPAPNASATDAGSDGVGQRCVQLRQGTVNSPIVTVDGIRVGQTWADAVTQDILAPVGTFFPANGSVNILLDVIPTITFNEPIKNTDGTEITNSNLSSLLTFTLTDASGTPVAYTATIDATKTIITVTPAAPLVNLQQYYLAIAPVKDGAGNISGVQSSTFTTIPGTLSSDATLSDLKVDGTTVSGFSSGTYAYSVAVPYGLPTVPVVSATTSFPLATSVITPAASIPGTTSILVTAQDGTTQLTYTVSFSYAPPSNNSSLSYIKWLPNGFDPIKQNIRVKDFESGIFDYNIEVPLETASLVVDAEPAFVIPASGCPPATYSVTQPVNLTGTATERTATIVCTAQDGITTSTYNVTFSKISASNVFSFKEGFDIMPPTGWTSTSNVGTSTGNGMGFYGSVSTYATPKFKWLSPADGGTLTTSACNGATTLEFFVKVLDKNASSNLHLYIEKSYDNSNWILVGQDPMPLTVSITQWHQVILPVNDNSPVIYFRFRATASTGDNTTGLFYLDDVSLTMNANLDATLSDLKVDGTTVAGFSPEVLSYNIMLPAGTTVVPAVTATTTQAAATASITNALALPGSTSVLVTAPDGITTKTYTINFGVPLTPPSDLTATVISTAQVDLAWSDNSTGEDGFKIERKPEGGLFAQIATVGSNVVTYSNTIPGLNPSDFIPANRFPNVTVTSGIKFADVTNYQGVPTSLYLDMYEPTGDNTQGRPVIIWIHGGGFRTDSYRTQGYIVDYSTRFAKRGYVCVSIDYRLRSAASMPTQASEFPALQDAARDANAAINWIKANASLYHINPNLIFIAGGSAGGRTAQTVCQFDGPDPTALYYPENLYLTTPWNKTGLVANATLWGGLEPEMRGWVYPYLQSTDIPTILVHGSADVTILPQNSIDLNDTLLATGVTSELHIIPGATHSCLGHETEISEWVAAFFAQEWNKINVLSTSYTYRVCAYNAMGNSDYSNEAIASFNKTLNLKLYLEGLYDGGVMRKAQDEYGDHYTGTVADKIAVELHDASNYANIIHDAGMLNLNIDGTATASIPGSNSGDYYITIKSRNSIETTTAAPVSFTNSTIGYDFTTSDSQAFGNNQKQLSAGVYGFFGGDANNDGSVDALDLIAVDNDATLFSAGYMNTDLNGDGSVDALDLILCDNNSTLFIATILP
jgi:acetyl esterase/lipase